jgi:carboxymethylenebutenolidase
MAPVQSVDLTVSSPGGPIPTVLSRPAEDGVYPAIVLGTEAWGITQFVRDTAERLASSGFVCAVPDFLRGEGLGDDNHDDFAAIMATLDALDFRRATEDLFATAGYLRDLPYVDGERIGTWGYCTGATMAMLFACLSRDVKGAALFYPSQPVFETLDAKKPAHPIDLLWNAHCPMLIMYGDEDPTMPPDRLEELRRRIGMWDLDCTIKIYPGAPHVFSTHYIDPQGNDSYRAEADQDSWATALDFIRKHVAGAG